MLNYFLVLIISIAVSFLAHDVIDRKWLGRKKRNLKLVIGKYHIHHSLFGALFILSWPLFTGPGYVMCICCGYGVGNIWQHKLTHNRVKEKGMVFITRYSK